MKSEDRKMKEIEMTKMVEEMDLRNLTPEVDMTDLVIATPDINRPALQLTGYYEHFANNTHLLAYALAQTITIAILHDFVYLAGSLHLYQKNYFLLTHDPCYVDFAICMLYSQHHNLSTTFDFYSQRYGK